MKKHIYASLKSSFLRSKETQYVNEYTLWRSLHHDTIDPVLQNLFEDEESYNSSLDTHFA
ncbi:hypothetical protein [Holospora elegans]|nr:hypothetical protein [Holospora elegans]